MKNDLKYLKTGLNAFDTLELNSTAKLLKQMNMQNALYRQLDEVVEVAE